MTAIMPCQRLKWYARQIWIAWKTIVRYYVTKTLLIYFSRLFLCENISASQNYPFKPSHCFYVRWLFIVRFVCVCDGVGDRFESGERRRWFDSNEFRYIRHKAQDIRFIKNHFPLKWLWRISSTHLTVGVFVTNTNTHVRTYCGIVITLTHNAHFFLSLFIPISHYLNDWLFRLNSYFRAK